MSPARSQWPFAAAALAFTILWFAMLSGRPLYDPDEGRYAEIPREMLAGGDFVIPHLDGYAYIEKPPLQYWLTAGSLAVFGPSEWAARLPTGVAGYCVLAAVYAIGRRLWGDAAALKALLLAGGSILFVLLGHQLTLDMSLTAWLTASLACFVFAQAPADPTPAREPGPSRVQRHARAWMLGCWAAMALATLTKGLIGLLIPGFTLLVYLLWQRDGATLRRLHVRYGLPTFVALAAPWFVLAARAQPEFLRFFFIREHLQRFLTPIEQRTEPWWFFAPVLIVGILPWITRAASVLATGWRDSAPPGGFAPRRLLWIWSVFVLVFFSSSNAKLIPYILPAIPALALLAAAPRGVPTGTVDRAQAAEHARRVERGHLFAGAAASLAFAIGVFVYASAVLSSPKGRALALELRPSLAYVGLALVAAAVVCGILGRRDRPLAALAALAAGWFAAAAAITVGATTAEQYFSAKDIALRLRAVASPGARVYSVHTYEQSLPFYLGRSVVLVDYRDEFAFGLGQDPARGYPTIPEFSRAWHAEGEAYAVMPARSFEQFVAAGVPMREIERYASRLVLVGRR
jgi:4-amino-4-deoxy-L-arabinose transferase-like glycosyltransferase